MSSIGASEYGSMTLRVDGVEVTVWKEYSFNSHFLTPTDGFRFVVGDEELRPELIKLLSPGKRVTLSVDGAVQCTGYIDKLDTTGDRTSGNGITVEGCDVLSPVVRAQIDPKHRYPDKTPLDKLLSDSLTQFGFTRFEIDNEANVNIAAKRALKRQPHQAKHPRKNKPLKQYPIPKSKPSHGDTYFAFLSRLTQRCGLWIWATVDGEGVVVSSPDYDQEPRYALRRKADGKANNVLRGGVIYDLTDQPSYIVARGQIPAREYDRMIARVEARNPFTFIEFLKDYERVLYTKQVFIPAQPVQVTSSFSSSQARPMYVQDNDSHTVEQLEKFAMRQMSLCARHAVTGRYTFPGHTLDGQPVQVDTVIDIDDDRSNWHGPMWILSRTFSKSRSGGTTCEIETLPLHALVF